MITKPEYEEAKRIYEKQKISEKFGLDPFDIYEMCDNDLELFLDVINDLEFSPKSIISIYIDLLKKINEQIPF